jgi:dTDP-4-amino-4,6-dideoxygalactose transaminase
MDRRKFVAGPLLAGVAAPSKAAREGKPAILGGEPVRATPFPAWPVFGDTEESGIKNVLRSGKWGRGNGNAVVRFEREYAQAMGVKGCLATANGTSALLTALNALGIGPGDEVIVPPYTFVATVNVILQQYALPVFAYSDR